jgi:hypothetical protein
MTGVCDTDYNSTWERLPIISKTGTAKKFYGVYLDKACEENSPVRYVQGVFGTSVDRSGDRLWIGSHGNMAAYVKGPVECGDSLSPVGDHFEKTIIKNHLRTIMCLEDYSSTTEKLLGVEM